MVDMPKLKVSVIITCKNEEDYIESCLKSVQYQTLKNFEIIVSDGKSKDNTVKIAKRYADKVIVEETNVSAGRNIGAANAKGEILIFVDADTVLLPETLEKILDVFKKKNVVGASCPAMPLTTEMKYVWLYSAYNNFARASIRFKRPHIAGFFCAYRKDAFNLVGGFDENFGTLEDFDLSKRIAKLGKIEFLSSTFVLTSHRRLKRFGLRTPERYGRAWIRMLRGRRGFSYDWYNSIR